MKKRHKVIFAAILAACSLYPAPRALLAANPIQTPPQPVPLRWKVETSRAQVAQFEAYRGETLLLEAEMRSYGKPLAISGEAKIYWQTNGMGSAWWSAPAAVKVGQSGERDTYSASWTPSMDAGAGVYNCIIGQPGGNYRAEFRLRLRPSPGAVPNTLDLPRQTIDFSIIDVINPPWPTQGIISNAVGGALGDFARTNSVLSGGPYLGRSETAAYAYRLSNMYGAEIAWAAMDGVWHVWDYRGEGVIARMSDVEDAVGPLSGAVSAATGSVGRLATTVNAWQTYWDGDDVRLTVTNYYGSMGTPSLYLEQKMPADDDHDAPWFRVVWDERTRWTEFLAGYSALSNKVENDLADRAWGLYDSSTGGYSPDGLLQLSQEQVQISAGMAWQKTVTAGGCAIWVLKATEPTTLTGTPTDGYFRIEDGDGTALLEIVKGDRRTVGATASAVNHNGTALVVDYAVVSDEHPALKISARLAPADWRDEDDGTVATVAWSGSSGAWRATITPVGTRPQLFAKATYEIGGETYVRHGAPLGVSRIFIDGKAWNVKVGTISGQKVLVLE